MTTEKNQQQNKKPKGPFRYGAIIPTFIVIGLMTLYFIFFFDGHLRRAIEYGATYANGAEVNVGYLKTSFLHASLDVENIQVTDKSKPAENIVQVGAVRFKALWDGLLRGKVVVPLASVTEIMVHTPRRHPGRVLPVKKSSESQMTTVKSQVLAETDKMLEGSIFGDLADLAKGTGYKEKLKEMEGNLKSSQYIKKVQDDLKTKEQQWKERISKLPKNEDFKAIEARIKSIKVDGKDPASIINAVKEADSLYKEIDTKFKAIKDSKDALSSDLNQYKNIYGDIKSQIDQDVSDLKGKMGIPSLDPKELAMRVFGRQFGDQIRRVEKYMRVAREYMPPPKAERKKDDITPHERSVGRNYKFPKTKAYPKLWIQKTEVSSKSTSQGFSGDIKGELLNITDDQHQTGLPMEIKLSGEFPHSNMYGVLIHGIMDHTTDIPKESGTLKVGSFPLDNLILSKSSDITFGFQKAVGSSELKAELQQENVQLNFDANFDKIAYLIEAKSDKTKDILSHVANGLGGLNLIGSASGPWNQLSLNLRSNLGEKLQAALSQEVNRQVGELQQKLREEIDRRVGQEKDKLLAQVKQFEEKTGLSLKSQDDAVNSLKQKLDDEKKKATSKQSEKLEDLGKKLLKGIKF